MKSRLSIAKKATEATPSLDRDRGYQATRIRGLAGLLRATWGGSLQELNNIDEVTFFVSSALDEIARGLDGGD